jgi:Membrane bound beta barrel domain (DUF5777)
MKRIFTLTALLFSLQLIAQDTGEKKPVVIFSSEKAINVTTTELVGKGKMAFKVTHNFGDIGGKGGGIKNFYGLDNAADIRIAFEIGLGKKFDITFARSKGASQQQRLWEMNLKYKLMQQMENDPSHPLSILFYANAVVSSNKASSFPNLDHSFRSFGDRTSTVLQLVLARKMGKVSLALEPTFLTRSYSISYDQKNLFALGGAIKLPLVANRLNLIVDYFHTFRNRSSKDSFFLLNNGIKFYDALGIGFEILTAGHVFRLNFTNATEILENRFIPRTITTWSKGQFRWGFTISRMFTLWREKKKK